MLVIPVTRDAKTKGTISILIALINSVPTGATYGTHAGATAPIITPTIIPIRIWVHSFIRNSPFPADAAAVNKLYKTAAPVLQRLMAPQHTHPSLMCTLLVDTGFYTLAFMRYAQAKDISKSHIKAWWK
jgi:hypothetical protein